MSKDNHSLLDIIFLKKEKKQDSVLIKTLTIVTYSLSEDQNLIELIKNWEKIVTYRCLDEKIILFYNIFTLLIMVRRFGEPNPVLDVYWI